VTADQPLTPAQRRMRSSLAAHTLWAGCRDRTAATAPAHAASPVSRSYWDRKVAAEAAAAGETPTAEELAQRADSAHRAHMTRLAFRSSKARAARAGRHPTGGAGRDIA
jgi:hypothetical protein